MARHCIWRLNDLSAEILRVCWDLRSSIIGLMLLQSDVATVSTPATHLAFSPFPCYNTGMYVYWIRTVKLYLYKKPVLKEGKG